MRDTDQNESRVTVARTRVGPRGRVTIAAAIQRETGVVEGDEVIVRAVAPGVVVIETVDAVMARIQDAAPPAPDGTTYDAVAEVREMRARETDKDAHTDLHPPIRPPSAVDDPGAELLRRLGL
ncbi:hypothetical protein ACU686_26430 [Yinghuangia aomiensis]